MVLSSLLIKFFRWIVRRCSAKFIQKIRQLSTENHRTCAREAAKFIHKASSTSSTLSSNCFTYSTPGGLMLIPRGMLIRFCDSKINPALADSYKHPSIMNYYTQKKQYKSRQPIKWRPYCNTCNDDAQLRGANGSVGSPLFLYSQGK